MLAKLRRARLIAGEDPHNPGYLDTHPLVREYFGDQLRYQRTGAWKECNRRLYNYYRKLAPQLPDSFREMQPLFSAAICGCNGDLFREALHEVYIPRIQRGNASFAANILGARGALLSVLAHFFEHGRWGSQLEVGTEGQSLTAEDQLFILMQTALYLTARSIRGAKLLRARGVFVPFPKSSLTPVFCADGSVALFTFHRTAGRGDAGCQKSSLPGAAGAQ
jgi:hypothetical protein